MYYLDTIISAICFLISHWPFIPYKAYVLVKFYLTNNPDKNNIDNNKDKQIYGKMHMVNWW